MYAQVLLTGQGAVSVDVVHTAVGSTNMKYQTSSLGKGSRGAYACTELDKRSGQLQRPLLLFD
jgi:hypothetical protein